MLNIIDHPSPNFDSRKGIAIRHLVQHYTATETTEDALKILSDPERSVSAHYLVAEDGTILRLVQESERAWHAGFSWWRGTYNLNESSIGIEIVNPGDRPFAPQQMQAVLELSKDIVARHKIEPINVVGHSDITPARKRDPGVFFDWGLLAKHGIALGPVEPASDPLWTDEGFLMALGRFGYDVLNKKAAVIAFQRHYRPDLVDGKIDSESRRILLRLLLDYVPVSFGIDNSL